MAGSGRLIAIGDVHGCVHALEALLAAIEPTAADELVFLGDIIDQGHDTRDVIELLISLSRQTPLVLVEGNHEQMMLAARDNLPALRYWENCGGVATLNSYRFGATLSAVPDTHWQFLSSGQPYYETGEFIFAHANYDPHLPMSRQPEHMLRWALLDPHDVQPHESGKTVLVGHTETRDSEILDLGFVVCIDTACWRHGWLTAIDVHSGEFWQASRWGMLRDPGEASHRAQLEHWNLLHAS